MSTIVTLSRGAQSATPFGYNAGDTSADRGSAFFTDFYTLEPFLAINFPKVDGACGLAEQTTNGSSRSTLYTQKIFTQTEDSAISFAVRLKITGSAASDSLNVGFCEDKDNQITVDDYNFGFSISNNATDKVTVTLNDTGTESNGVTQGLTTGKQLPADFAATDYHVYGAELIRQNGTNTCTYFVDGKKVHTFVSTAAAMDPMLMVINSIGGAVVTQKATVDWASISMPRA